MNLDKATLYDWDGMNETIFKAINGFHTEIYDSFMILISQLADKHNAPYYLAALAVWVSINFLIKKIRSGSDANHYMVIWFGVFLVLIASLVIDREVVKMTKENFSYPRPIAALGPWNVALLDTGREEKDNYFSFPSGHVSLVTVFVVALSPVLSEFMLSLGILLIPLTALSRIAVGRHFPADVLGGFLISLIITLLVRALIRRVLRIRC